MESIPQKTFTDQVGHRLVPSKYPPVALFDDVANHAEFEVLFAIQSLTNPRLRQELGSLNRVPAAERPYGIRGCNYALGPFVHLNPAGSRFSRGDFGVYYAALDVQTAIAETRYHQQRYFAAIEGLKYDRIAMRCLKTQFSARLHNITAAKFAHSDWYHPDNYTAARILGDQLKAAQAQGIVYRSVRNSGTDCYALFTPKVITDVIQTGHYEYIWDGKEISVALATEVMV